MYVGSVEGMGFVFQQDTNKTKIRFDKREFVE